MNKKYVSVIIPVYNAEKYIEECLDSVVKQTIFENIQIICINDCSSDRTLEILRIYEKKYDNFMIVDLTTNHGPADARNIGVDRAIGDYIYFLDADDYLENNALEYLYDIAIRENLDILTFESTSFYEDKAPSYTIDFDAVRKNKYEKETDSITLFSEMSRNGDFYCMPWLYFIKRDYITNNKLKYLEVNVHEDILFSFMLHIMNGREKVINIILHHYRRHEGSITYDKNMIKHLMGFIKSYKYMMDFVLDNKLNKRQYEAFKIQSNAFIDGILFHTNRCCYEDVIDMKDKLDIELLAMYEAILYKRKIPLLPSELINDVKDGKKIYIYGAGVKGNSINNKLSMLNIDVTGYIVTNPKKDDIKNSDVFIMGIDDISQNDEDSVVIVGVSDKFKTEIKKIIEAKQLKMYDLDEYVI